MQPLANLQNDTGFTYYQAFALPELQALYSTWAGDSISFDCVKEGADTGLRLMKERDYTLLLNDNSRLSGAWATANEWIANDWMPRAVDAGIRKFAHVVSPDIFTKLSGEFMQRNAQGLPFEIQLFETYQEAYDWLKEVPVQA